MNARQLRCAAELTLLLLTTGCGGTPKIDVGSCVTPKDHADVYTAYSIQGGVLTDPAVISPEPVGEVPSGTECTVEATGYAGADTVLRVTCPVKGYDQRVISDQNGIIEQTFQSLKTEWQLCDKGNP